MTTEQTSLAPVLSPTEIVAITHYKRPAEQLRVLRELGIPARRRHDNTVCVLRMHTLVAAANQPARTPTLKSSRNK